MILSALIGILTLLSITPNNSVKRSQILKFLSMDIFTFFNHQSLFHTQQRPLKYSSKGNYHQDSHKSSQSLM